MLMEKLTKLQLSWYRHDETINNLANDVNSSIEDTDRKFVEALRQANDGKQKVQESINRVITS